MTLENQVKGLETALENLAKCRCAKTLHVVRARLDALMNGLFRSPSARERLGRRVKRQLERDPNLKDAPWRKELVSSWTTDAIADELMLMAVWTGDDPAPTIVTQARQAVEKGLAFSLVTFLKYRIRLVALRERRGHPISLPPREEGGIRS